MSINILSQDGTILVNYSNVASLFVIKQEYGRPSALSVLWEIKAKYPAVSGITMYDTLARFKNEEDCRKAFAELMNGIYFENAIIKL